jgi:hypothetical protein
MTNQKKANLLSAVRNFGAECTLANSWGLEEAKTYGMSLELLDAQTWQALINESWINANKTLYTYDANSFYYSLFVDGKLIYTKKIVLTK